jgi:spermidine synthase
VILSIYLGATWLGSYAYRRLSRQNELQDVTRVWVFLGLLALLPFPFTDPALPVQKDFLWAVFRTIGGIGPFSAVLGFVTPLLVDDFSHGEPRRAGKAYAVNILGGILGPLATGFLILPWIGERWGLLALALPLFGMGLWVISRPRPNGECVRAGRGPMVSFALAVVLGAILVTMTNTYRIYYTDRVEMQDYMASVMAGTNRGRKLLLINGVGMTGLVPITKYMAHMPLAFLDRQPQKGLVICFGMGTTFRSMLSWNIDTTVVELDPSVPKLFSYFHEDAPALVKAPLAHVVVDDGRRYLERTSDMYDVITMDPPPPISTPTTSLLYSREFYTVVKKHLRPGGIFQAWQAIIDPGWDLSTQTAFAKALRDSFPYVRVFPSLWGVGFHMLASDQPITIRSAEALAARMPARAAADFIEWTPDSTPAQMFDIVLRTEQQLSRLASIRPAVPAIQDDRPINEYYFLRRISGQYP